MIRADVCPRTLVDRDTWAVVDAAALARKGAWPVHGGTLDQVHGLLKAIRYVWSVEDMERARLRTSSDE